MGLGGREACTKATTQSGLASIVQVIFLFVMAIIALKPSGRIHYKNRE